jgi:hypothetical protein
MDACLQVLPDLTIAILGLDVSLAIARCDAIEQV